MYIYTCTWLLQYVFDVNDDEDEVLVSLEQQDTRELTIPGGRDMHAIGFTITKVILQKGRTFLI